MASDVVVLETANFVDSKHKAHIPWVECGFNGARRPSATWWL